MGALNLSNLDRKGKKNFPPFPVLVNHENEGYRLARREGFVNHPFRKGNTCEELISQFGLLAFRCLYAGRRLNLTLP